MKHKFLLLCFCLLTFSLAAQKTQIGIAEVYDDLFQGRTMTSGEKYDKNKPIAAHQTLAFGTILKVTNTDNRKSVIVVVKDRGPYVKGHIVKLSRSAAAEIGITESASVRIQILGLQGYDNEVARSSTSDDLNLNDPKLSPYGLFKVKSDRVKTEGFGVQIALFTNYTNMLKQVNLLQSKGFDNVLIETGLKDGKDFYKIIVGPLGDRKKAESMQAKLKKKGVNGFVVEL